MTGPAAPARRGMRAHGPLVALLAAHGLSLAGNAITLVVVPLYVLLDTGSALATGAAGIAATAPMIVGGALGGVVVDRLGFRRAAIAADVASGVTILAIPVLAATVGLPFWALLALVFLSGLLDTPGSTAKAALIPDLAQASGARLTRVTGAESAISRSASLVGAAVAAICVAWIGPLNAMILDAATFAVSAALIFAFCRQSQPEAEQPATPATGYWREFADGMRYLGGTPIIRNLVLLIVVTNLIDAAGLMVLKPVYASRVSDDGSLFGVMVAVFAAGALTGAALYGWVGHRLPRRATLVLCFLFAGAPPYLAMALGIPVAALLLVFGLSGLAAGSINPMIDAMLYERVPRAMRARVLGALTTGVSLGMPLGSFAAGIAVTQWGLVATAAVAGGVYLIASLAPLVGRSWAGISAPGPGASNTPSEPLSKPV